MNKERLKEIKDSIDFQELIISNDKDLDYTLLIEEKELYDYAVNLQQENKQLKEKSKVLEENNKLLIQQKNQMYEDLDIAYERIDKAINYIRENDLYSEDYWEEIGHTTANDEVARKDLLEILGGTNE